MKLILTGATGFAGGEVLRQALNDAEIERVTVLTRRPSGVIHEKLRELVLDEFLDYSRVDLNDCDACISADPGETKSALFARIKGRTERALSELGGDIVNFRPGYIRASAQSGPRKDLARLAAPLGAILSFFNTDFSVDCDQLARCLLDVAKHGSDQKLLVNQAIRGWTSGKTAAAAPRLGSPMEGNR